MSQALGRTYLYDILLFIVGFIFMTIASQIVIAENETDSRKLYWKVTLYTLGSASVGLAALGSVLLHTIYEYKLLQLK